MIISLKTIEKRNKGLATFVEGIKSYTNPHEPVFTDVRITILANQGYNLLEP